jgi:hypothetical protein
MRYAQDPKARSTPTLSPSRKVFSEAPARHSNVDIAETSRAGPSPYSIGKKSSEFVAAWTQDQNNQDPMTRKLDGLLTQHIQQEKDLIKRVARGKTAGAWYPLDSFFRLSIVFLPICS